LGAFLALAPFGGRAKNRAIRSNKNAGFPLCELYSCSFAFGKTAEVKGQQALDSNSENQNRKAVLVPSGFLVP
jgi:hypothetical protein